MKRGESNRLLALEGLRGIAAIVVVIYHVLLIFWCYTIYGPVGNNGIMNMHLEDNLFANPLTVFFSGPFAVAIFFVLSGFVLSIGFFTTGKVEIVKKLAAKRYLRLMLPALASVMIAWIILTLGFSHNSQALPLTHSVWLEGQWNFSPNFFEAIHQGTWGIFVSGAISYNPVLWTMMYEFAGSFIVFVSLMLFGKLERRWIVYGFLLLLTFSTWFMAFIAGMILADLYAKKRFPFNGSSSKFMVFILLLGLFLGGYPVFAPTEASIYNTLRLPMYIDAQNLIIYTSIGAVLVIIGSLAIPAVTKFLSHKYISGLGKYTFSVYLVHKLVLFSLTTGLLAWFITFMGYNQAALLSILISIPVIVLSTYLFERYIDAPSIHVSGVFANWLLGLPQKVGPTAYSEQPKPGIIKRILSKLRLKPLRKKAS